jgi:A/G-specific adenine glycosylase
MSQNNVTLDNTRQNINWKEQFVSPLLRWNKFKNHRQMPWKGEKNPYKIWISEIILQQTRVEQGLGYYERFLKAFPNVQALAEAPEQEVFKLWEGLGYYSRCKNLIASAKYIHNEQNDLFPEDYRAILALKGVGCYTAAAIASFAYNLPYAVLDGNVFRVLSRVFDIETPIDSLEGKKLFSALAQNILPLKKSGEYNQALMDFGATVCKPLPECSICFFKTNCPAFLQGKQRFLPVKSKQIAVKERWFNYIIPMYETQYGIRKRTNKDIWQNLFEFLLIVTGKKISLKKQLLLFQKSYGITLNECDVNQEIIHAKQRLTHQIIHFQFIKVEFSKMPSFPQGIIWVKGSQLKNYPFPKTLQQYIQSQF